MTSRWRESFLSEDVRIEGRLIFDGILKISGTFEGDIYSLKDLIVLEGGFIKGRVEAEKVVVAGRLEGEVVARTKLEILPSGFVKAAVFTPILKIHEGGILEGTSSMSKLDLSLSGD